MCIYRPPGCELIQLNQYIELLLQNVTLEKAECVLAGDFNVNLLNYDSHNDTDQFINTMYSYSFLPLITRPTRSTSTSTTLIDNIMTNVFNDAIVSGILVSDVSDHLSVSLCI